MKKTNIRIYNFFVFEKDLWFLIFILGLAHAP